MTRWPGTCYAAWHSFNLSTIAESELFTWQVQLSLHAGLGSHICRSRQNWWRSSASEHQIVRHLTGGSGGIYHENLKGRMEEIPGVLIFICPQPQTNYFRKGNVVHRLCRNSGSGCMNHRGVPHRPQTFSFPD